MALILVLWLTLILAGISMNKDGQKPFCLKQTICLRGICAVEIMTGHIGLATGSVVLYPNRKAGILFVGIFFMLSGYGVVYGMEHKADYSKQFLLNRTIKLLIPAYAVKTIMLLTDNFLSGFTGGGYRRHQISHRAELVRLGTITFLFYLLGCKKNPAGLCGTERGNFFGIVYFTGIC